MPFRSGLPVFCVGLLLLSATAPRAQAQDDGTAEPDTSLWVLDAAGKFSASQAAYKDWQEGGLNTVSFTTTLSGTAQREGGRWTQAHNLRLAFGLLSSEDDEPGEPLRKTDDQVRLESTLRYRGNSFFRVFKPTIASNVRTQFASGFDYTNNPFPDGSPAADEEPPVQTSAFFSPAFVRQSLGLTYAPQDWYSARLGAAAKETFVLNDELRVLYDVSPGKVARVEGGAEFAAEVDREIATNIRYTSSLNVFFSFNQVEDPPDVVFENYLILRVNSWLTTDLQFVALFDQNTTDAIQLKEVLSVGVTFVLI